MFSLFSDYELVPSDSVKFWTGFFDRYFFSGETSDITRDDMLFYVRKERRENRHFVKVCS